MKLYNGNVKRMRRPSTRQAAIAAVVFSKCAVSGEQDKEELVNL
jgi:hypothetical protein